MSRLRIILLLLSINLWSLDISNVSVSQRSDGSKLADIYYDLDGSFQFFRVSLEASLDGGLNYYPILNLTGDHNYGVTPGAGKHVVWDLGVVWNEQFTDSASIKITAVQDDTPPDGWISDIDGNLYETIPIGDQIWMMSNLKVTHFRNGEPISSGWPSNSGAYTIYNNNGNGEIDTYGALYNWYALNDMRNIAPEGWHVPTDAEWKELEIYLGMSPTQANGTGYRGTNQGSQLAGNDSLWMNGTLVNNAEFGTSGFTALPGGFCSFAAGSYFYLGESASFWTATQSNGSYAWYRMLHRNESRVARDSYGKQFGYSVRCVKD